MKTPIRVLLPLSVLPDNTVVSKPTGEKQYTLKRVIKIYGNNKELKADEGTAFLVCQSGNINAVNEAKQHAVDFDSTEDARDFLEEIEFQTK